MLLLIGQNGFTLYAKSQTGCDSFANSGIAHEILQLVAKSKQLSITHLNFKIHEKILILTDSKYYPLCALVSQNGIILEKVTLNTPLENSNGIYTFANTLNPLGEQDQRQLSQALSKITEKEFFIYNTGVSFLDAFDNQKSNTLRYHFAFIVHEAFHLLGQTWRNNAALHDVQQAHFGFNNSQVQSFVQDRCYGGTPEIKNHFKTEIEFLSQAYQNALEGKKDEAFKRLADYIKQAEKRYLLTDSLDITFSHESWLRKATCHEVEEELKFKEGGAEFVEVSYLQSLNLIAPLDLIQNTDYVNFYIREGSSFYYIGMLELTVLKLLDTNFETYLKTDYAKQDLLWNDNLPFFRLKNLTN